LSTLRPELRTLALVPIIEPDGRRTARIGRLGQSAWFEGLLTHVSGLELVPDNCCDISWGGPDPAKAPLSLTALTPGRLFVDGKLLLLAGQSAPLHPGSSVGLCVESPSGEANQLEVLLSLGVHCAFSDSSGVNGSGLAPTAMGSPGNGSASPASKKAYLEATLTHPAPGGMADYLTLSNRWTLDCIYAQGLSTEAFWALEPASRRISFDAGGEPFILGRQHQLKDFELLLDKDTKLLQYVSRQHFKLEQAPEPTGSVTAPSTPPDDGASVASVSAEAPTGPRLLVTNLSQNVALASQRPLRQHESAEVQDGETISLAHSIQNEGDATSCTFVPFLTFRLIGPPRPPAASPFVMTQPPSLLRIGSQEETPKSRPTSPPATPTSQVPIVVVSAARPLRIESQDSMKGVLGSSGGFGQLSSPAGEAVSAAVPKTMPLTSLPSPSERGTGDMLGDSFDKTRATACWGASALGNLGGGGSSSHRARPSSSSARGSEAGDNSTASTPTTQCCLM